MKVSQNLPPNASQVTETRNQPAAPAKLKNTAVNPAGLGGDNKGVEISEDAKFMKQASDIAKSSPDVRAEKVAALKQAIQNGTYKIEAGAIADKLLEDHLGTDFGKNNL